MNELEQLSKDILITQDEFRKEMNDNVANKNKTAGQRARKLSLKLGDLLKRYRAESVQADKNNK